MINLKKQFKVSDFRKFVRNEGKVFSVTFVKKDGSVRKMVARLGVRSYLTGGKPKYNADDRGMVVVFSMDDLGYRTITLDRVLRLKAYKQVLNLQD
jgi:hypothetical protein